MKKVRIIIMALAGICLSGLVSCNKGSGSEDLCHHEKAEAVLFKNAIERQSTLQLVDYRSKEEYDKGHLPNAVNIPVSVVDLNGTGGNCAYVDKVMAVFDTQIPLFVYGGNDAFGTNGMAVPGQLACKFTSVSLMVGGYNAWVKEGLPTE